MRRYAAAVIAFVSSVRPPERVASLQTRLLIAASLVLLAFLGLTGLSLERAFRNSTLAAIQERLQAQVYMLLGAAELDQEGRFTLPEELPEARFSTPGSGLYAQVVDRSGKVLWRSPSLLGKVLPSWPAPPALGKTRFVIAAPAGTTPVFVLGFTVNWEISTDQYRRYTFYVAQSQQPFQEQLSSFRQHLWGWLLVPALLLLLVQGLILRWSLKPLRQVTQQLKAIEAGEQTEFSGPYPRELLPLTDNLNALLHRSQRHLERYRQALGNLAHSLKTPLAVLRNALEQPTPAAELRDILRQQVDGMNQTVAYQLQRAAAAGPLALAKPLALEPIARRVMASLAKVYADRSLRFEVQVEPALVIHGDEGDFMEILGNLGDNACKWSRNRVILRAYGAAAPRGRMTILDMEDDGPGIPTGQVPVILSRGGRIDPSVAGHGIGLAVVRDLVEEVYRGTLEIGSSPSGGARVRVCLPS